MKALSIQDLPHSDALKLFELGYAAGNCLSPDQFQAVLKKLVSVFPVNGLLCGLGGLEGRAPIASLWDKDNQPTVQIAQVIPFNWPPGFLQAYLSENLMLQDGQFYACLKSQEPLLWMDVYEKNKHDFNPRTKKGFHPRFVEIIFDYKDNLTLRCLPVDAFQNVSNFSLNFHSREEAYKFKGLFQAFAPYLHNAILRAYGKNGHYKLSDSSVSLSARECEVLKWLIAGKSNWEIGVILHISERTAKYHIQNLMQKFAATNRYQLVANAFEEQIDGLPH